jgi:hypothetical protein
MATAPSEDPRLKRVLKRYRKANDFPDASMDVTTLGMERLRWIAGSAAHDPLIGPVELDEAGAGRLSKMLGIPVESNDFDYILHTYIRTECVAEYYADETARPRASPENGPPMRPPPGMRWQEARPRDGKEHYVGVPAEDP